MSALRAVARSFRAVSGGIWRDHPARFALAVLGIALGVALGVAVHLMNASAANEFGVAVRSLSGTADLVIRAPRSGFPEAIYPEVARLPGVRAASPALEIDAGLPGTRDALKVIAIDMFRAAAVQPHLVAEHREALLDLFKADSVILSRAAADALGLGAGDVLRLQSGTAAVALRIVGLLPAGATRQRIGVMDIASAQWQFARLGTINRIDVKLEPGIDVNAFSASLQTRLPAGVVVATPAAEADRSANLTQAYRTNLDMLALVALITGGFFVFSTQFLALTRRRPQLALLRVVGLSRSRLLRFLVVESALAGAAGSALGVGLGCAIARWGLERLGGDLGAGYFRSVTPTLYVEGSTLLVFFVLGVAFALAGAAGPAAEAARRAPALALKAGDEEQPLQQWRRLWPGLLLIATGLALTQLPVRSEIPVHGYVAIGLILIGAIVLMPRFAEFALAQLPALRSAPAALAAAQLQGTPRQVGVSLAAILASFSLMVSMLIMVGSFRDSLEVWLGQMLPADLYVRAGRTGDTAYLTRENQTRIAQVQGLRSAVFIRSQQVYLRPDRPPLTLLARPVAAGSHPDLAFQGSIRAPRQNEPASAWISEAAADLLHVAPGDPLELPIAGRLHRFTVAGVWRDYARQNGAVVIDRNVYVALTGDDHASEAALYLENRADANAVAQSVRTALGDPEGIEIASARELKEVSLAIFDRTFAITYALEIAAVMIGLFGVSASFGAQALARRREFGVLRHIGMTRRQIAAMLGCEGAIVGALGVAAGLTVGALVSVILIHVINRQSFHWSMDMHLPWQTLGLLAVGLIAAASLTAMLSARRVMSADVIRAVREDW